LRREASFGRQLWGLLSLELWFRAFIDGDRVQRTRSEARPVAVAR